MIRDFKEVREIAMQKTRKVTFQAEGTASAAFLMQGLCLAYWKNSKKQVWLKGVSQGKSRGIGYGGETEKSRA